MNFKSKIFLVGLILIMLLSISVTAAQENSTDISINEVCDTHEGLTSAEDLVLETSCNNDNLSNPGITNENTLGMAGTFYDKDEIVDEFGDSIIISTNNITISYKSTEKIPIKFAIASSGEPLSYYPVEVNVFEYYNEWDATGDTFYGKTNAEGVFYISLKNMWAGTFFISANIMLDSDNEWGFYSENFAKITIAKSTSKLSTHKLRGTTKSSLLTACATKLPIPKIAAPTKAAIAIGFSPLWSEYLKGLFRQYELLFQFWELSGSWT